MTKEIRKIKVQGKVRLGTELQLTRDIPEPEPSDFVRVRAIAPEWIRVTQGAVPDDEHGLGIRQDRYVYTLRPTSQHASIKDQGLCQSYGIFGNPGVGKTYLL